MDTTTVLEIIKMIDNKLVDCIQPSENEDEYDQQINIQWGIRYGFEDIRNHLQNYIEAQLNAAELQSGE